MVVRLLEIYTSYEMFITKCFKLYSVTHISSEQMASRMMLTNRSGNRLGSLMAADWVREFLWLV